MTPKEQIDAYLQEQESWKGTLLKQLRELIHKADPEITEEWKWDVPVFTHNGMVCAISSFKDHVKINFFKGAALVDRHSVFNNGLTSKLHRSIDFTQDDKLNEEALKDLIQQAVTINTKK